jgi:hypothetical protein
MPAQKSRIIQAFLAPAMLGAPEALAVGWLNVLLIIICLLQAKSHPLLLFA